MSVPHDKNDFLSATQFTSEEIKKILPHRYPFLLVDRIIEIEATRAVGIKNVTVNEPFFEGHFPARAVMPGVLIVESMAQIAGIVSLRKINKPGALAFLAGLDEVRFREPVVPGDQLVIETRLVKEKARFVSVEATAKVKEKTVCEAKLMFMILE